MSETEPKISGICWAAAGAIVLLAALMRFADLENRPAGLFRDEAEKGYNGWSLATEQAVIETPLDPAGRIFLRRTEWPYLINVMGVTTSAVYQYASAPLMNLFGLTVASTRMAAALAGTLTVAALAILLLRIWSIGCALAAILWLALCPWHYLFSRWAAQGIFAPLGMVLTLVGCAAIEKTAENARAPRWAFPAMGAGLGFGFYSYSGAQPFVLAWGLTLFILYRKTIRGQLLGFMLGLGVFLLCAGPTLWVTAFGGGGARLQAVAVWTAEDATPLRTAGRLLSNFFAHFNPVFLFIRGDSLARHGIPGWGQLLLIDAALMPIGIYVSLKRRIPLARPLLLAFLLGPIGAAITRIGIPHALRALPMVLPAAIWGGLGLAAAIEWLLRLGTSSCPRSHSPSAAPTGQPPRVSKDESTSANQTGRFPPKNLILAALLAAACLAYAGRIYQIYWRSSLEEHPVQLPELGFGLNHRLVFEKVFYDRRPDEKVWINGGIPYAAYLVLFFGKVSSAELASRGFEGLGFNLLNPGETTPDFLRERARPGDWIIDFAPGSIHGEIRFARIGR